MPPRKTYCRPIFVPTPNAPPNLLLVYPVRRVLAAIVVMLHARKMRRFGQRLRNDKGAPYVYRRRIQRILRAVKAEQGSLLMLVGASAHHEDFADALPNDPAFARALEQTQFDIARLMTEDPARVARVLARHDIATRI